MNFEHFERGYLLPKGCKDLIDVIMLHPNPQAQPETEIFLKFPFIKPKTNPKPKTQTQADILLNKPASAALPNQPPALKGDLFVPDHTTIKDLGTLLGQKPFKIIADAMELGVFANVNQPLNFQTISQIAAKYGYTAKKRTD